MTITAETSMDSVQRAMRLLQFGDSVLPVGSFTFSNALESAVQEGFVFDTGSLELFVRTATRTAASGDGIALLAAHRSADAGDIQGVLQADHAVFVRKLNEEMRTMTIRMGRKLAELAVPLVETPVLATWTEAVLDGRSPGTYPTALGVVFAGMGVPEQEAFAVHQYGVAMMILSAALRLMKIDHTETQSILFRVNADAAEEYASAALASLHEMSTFAPLTDVLAAVHVKSHVRMFMD